VYDVWMTLGRYWQRQYNPGNFTTRHSIQNCI